MVGIRLVLTVPGHRFVKAVLRPAPTAKTIRFRSASSASWVARHASLGSGMRVVRVVQKWSSLLQKAETASGLNELSSSFFTRTEVVHSDDRFESDLFLIAEQNGPRRSSQPRIILWRNKLLPRRNLCLTQNGRSSRPPYWVSVFN